MKDKVLRLLEYGLLIINSIWLVIIGFSSPRFINIEDPYINETFKQAESINYLFRTAIIFILVILIIWRLFRPSKVMRVISMIIFLVTLIFTILDFTNLIDYRDILILKKF
jgi:hypothetical protein